MKRSSLNEIWLHRFNLPPVGICFAVGVMLTLVCVRSTSAQSGTDGIASSMSAHNSDHGLTGFWALRFDSRNVPEASLVPGISAKQIAALKEHDAHAVRWCLYQGTPAMMDSGARSISSRPALKSRWLRKHPRQPVTSTRIDPPVPIRRHSMKPPTAFLWDIGRATR